MGRTQNAKSTGPNIESGRPRQTKKARSRRKVRRDRRESSLKAKENKGKGKPKGKGKSKPDAPIANAAVRVVTPVLEPASDACPGSLSSDLPAPTAAAASQSTRRFPKGAAGLEVGTMCC